MNWDLLSKILEFSALALGGVAYLISVGIRAKVTARTELVDVLLKEVEIYKERAERLEKEVEVLHQKDDIHYATLEARIKELESRF